MKKIKINDITIRDIFQSIDSGHINEKMLARVIEQLGKIKFDSFEVLGGSAFEKMLSGSLYKTPFEIIYNIKNKNPNLKLQALIGAKNLAGMEIYSNEAAKKFIMECRNCGIESFRVYDSLNDLDNFRYIVPEIAESGADCQGTLIYDNLEETRFYIDLADKLIEMGCTGICIKDVESTLLPGKASNLFKELTDNINGQFYLSGYNLRGLQVANYYSACISGCSGIDLSFIPSSYNDLSPAIFPFLLSLKDTSYYSDADYLKILEVFEWFKRNIYTLIKNELLHSRFIFSNKNQNLLPKWLLSSLNKQLIEIGEHNKIDTVCEEVFKIKNEIGNPSLSTPVGQIIGSQAILNTIISDYRWEITNDEIKKLISGYYGRLPRKVDPEIKEKIFHDSENSDGISGGFSHDNNIYSQCEDELKELSGKSSEILSYMFFPEKTLTLLKIRKNEKPAAQNKEKNLPETGELFPDFLKSQTSQKLHEIDIQKLKDIANLVETSNIDEINLELDGIKVSINKKASGKSGRHHPVRSAETESDVEPIPKLKEKEAGSEYFEVRSPIVGTYYSSPSPGSSPFIKTGMRIKKGDTLCIIEAMKLMNKINSEIDGTVEEILVKNEETVEYDQLLIKIKK